MASLFDLHEFEFVLQNSEKASLVRIATALEMRNSLHIAKELHEHNVIDDERYMDILSKVSDIIGKMADCNSR